MVNREGLASELSTLAQPTLVLSGEADKRAAQRVGFEQGMRACELQTLPGCNVLPWEEPASTAKAVASFVGSKQVAG